MKKLLFVIFLPLLFLSCSKKTETVAAQTNNNEIPENEIEEASEDYSSEDTSYLEVLRPIIEIQLGTERTIVESQMASYRIDKKDDTSISYNLFKNDYLLIKQDEAGEEINAEFEFDENQKLKAMQIYFTGTLEKDTYNRVVYSYYNTIKAFVKKYAKVKAESFHFSEEEFMLPCVDLWKTKKEKILLSSEAMDLFGYTFTCFQISKIAN